MRYVESESVPSDARIIGQTWQYVNKKGGPDKRFKNNRQLPICAYSQLNLSTSDGLDVRFFSSKEGASMHWRRHWQRFERLSADSARVAMCQAGYQVMGYRITACDSKF